MRGKLTGGKEIIIDKVELVINIAGTGNADIIINNGLEEIIVSAPFPKTLRLPPFFKYTFKYKRLSGGMVKWIFNGVEIFTQSFERYLLSNPCYLTLQMTTGLELYIVNTSFGVYNVYYVDGVPYTDKERMFNFPSASSHSVYFNVSDDIPVYDMYVRLANGGNGTLLAHQEDGTYSFTLNTHSNLYLSYTIGGGGLP